MTLRLPQAKDPHLILALAAAVVIVLEGLRGSQTMSTSVVWPLAQAVVAGAALLAAWPLRDRLRLPHLLALALAFQLAWICLHLALGVQGDGDPLSVYPSEGNALRHGTYPHSEYPPGAVALFTLETLLGGGAARIPNAFLMVPFQLGCVAGIWALRTRWSGWLAAFVALWPLNAFYWEFRFDLVPTAALVVGLLLAYRERWYEAGFVLGLGAIVKWTPALSAAALLLWLLRTKRVTATATVLAGFAIPVLVANVPILLWNRSALLAAYTTQNARTVTAESMVYLPLRLFWQARPGYWYFGGGDVPPIENRVAVQAQIAAVALALLLTAVARSRAGAIAMAALVPAVFLLMNRIFSPQFFVLVLASFAIAAALVASNRLEALGLAVACAVGTTANTVLFQTMLGAEPVASHPGWTYVSAAAFVPAACVCVWLTGRALRQRAAHGAPSQRSLPAIG